MGVTPSQQYAKKQKMISVISLNYSGILLSPFEFFSKETEQMSQIETNLSNIYKRLLKQYRPKEFNEDKKKNEFKWSLGKIDQKMQKQRYSPLYRKQAGLQNGKLLSEQQFKNKWLQVFKQNIEQFKQKDPGFKYTEQQKSQAVQFDLLCYKTILLHVYPKLKTFSANQLHEINPQNYKQFMSKMFDKTFLNEDKKLDKTLHAMKRQQVDIVFAQQANQNLINRIEKQYQGEYVVFRRKGSDSIIIVRKLKFHNFYNEHGKYPLIHLPQIEKQLSWNDDTVVAFVDNLILISGHLSSKKQKNPQQVFDMMQSLKKLNAIYPMCHIIVGCDANSFVPDTYAKYCKQNGIKCQCQNKGKSEGTTKAITQTDSIQKIILPETKAFTNCVCFKPQNCQIYPHDSEIFTTSKQRTYLQPQINKAEETARVCRDHLIIFKAEDISVDKAKVCTINDKDTKLISNLPCEQHPYDHYVVKGEITVNVMTHFGRNFDDGK